MAKSRLLEVNRRRSGAQVTCKTKERAAVEVLGRNLCKSKGCVTSLPATYRNGRSADPRYHCDPYTEERTRVIKMKDG